MKSAEDEGTQPIGYDVCVANREEADVSWWKSLEVPNSHNELSFLSAL